MQLVERHVINKTHKYFSEIDHLCLLSKNLYNSSTYVYRQNYFNNLSTDASKIYHQLKSTVEYKALPAKVSQNILRTSLRNWTSYYAAIKAYYLTPEKFKGKPNIPHYKGTISKQRLDGRYQIVYNYQAISKKELKKGVAHPSGTNIYISTKVKDIKELRLVPRKGHYVVEIIYTREENNNQLPLERVASIDLGLNNLATLTYNIPKLQPTIYDGRAIKSTNQYVNKKVAELQSKLPKNQKSSNQINRLWLKRNMKVDYYLHTTSKAIIDKLVKHNIGTLVIGWNKGFKDSINIGKVNNQKFVAIPHKKLIEQLQYKAILAGIKVVLVTEEYTTKCSALDNEPIQKHIVYMGKRVKRGLFKTSLNIQINADINGSLNILRKYIQVVGNASAHPIEGVVVHPVRVKPYKENCGNICP
jgi:IS605 OrfB family transposase